LLIISRQEKHKGSRLKARPFVILLIHAAEFLDLKGNGVLDSDGNQQ
jgi:hypothetical protein